MFVGEVRERVVFILWGGERGDDMVLCLMNGKFGMRYGVIEGESDREWWVFCCC